MADPLCRWRFATESTLIEIVDFLPKSEMPATDFWKYLEAKLDAKKLTTFKRTAYQFAVQLGLYYIDGNDIYHPRFRNSISAKEAKAYLQEVAENYVAPNPYTSGSNFGENQKIVHIHDEIVSYARNLPVGAVFKTSDALDHCFECQLGNLDAITTLMSYAGDLEKKASDSLSYIPINQNQLDRVAFFSLFGKEPNGSCLNKETPDLLLVALKVFNRERVGSVWKKLGIDLNWKVREYFGKLDVEKLDAAGVTELFEGVRGESGKVVYRPMWAGSPGAGWWHIKTALEKDQQQGGDDVADATKTALEKEEADDVAEAIKNANPVDVINFIRSLKYSRDKFFAVFEGKSRASRVNGCVGVPSGFGATVISELLMKFHPKDCISWVRWHDDVLLRLGIVVPHEVNDGVKNYEELSQNAYCQILGQAAKILRKMWEMKIPRAIKEDGTPDGEDADYLTVNEFVWFVKEKWEMIQKEISMSKMINNKFTPYAGTAELKFKKDDKDDELLLRIMAALKAKPFVILAGHSGTGKSRFAKKLAYMTCNADELREKGRLPGNLLMLQVKPNWHDSTELLGYRNAIDKNRWQKTALTEFIFKAYHFPETPFILCLDEMNLAPVEQYFAEFLSAMESKEPVPIADINAEDDNLFELGCKWTDSLDVLKQSGFSIPKNLFIIGTVNMDETTNQFSRKVLDRAFTIEMTDVDFTSFGSVKTPCYEDTIKEDPIKELLKCDEEVTKLDDDDKDSNSALNAVQQALKNTPFAIAYRFAAEYTLLKRALEKFDVAEDPNERIGLDALDQAVLMKVLPRIAGEADYIRESVYGVESDYKKVKSVGLMQALGAEVSGAQSKPYSKKEKSIAKINEILLRAKATGAMAINFWP